MEDVLSDARKERREEIKLKLEIYKTVVSILGVAAIFFAALQWMEGNKAANQATYQRMSSEWRSHLEFFVSNPEFRQYFYDNKNINDADRDKILSIADIRLDAIDAILTFAAGRWDQSVIAGWNATFISAFRNSPVMCHRIRDEWPSYGHSRRPALAGCREHWGGNPP